MIINFDSFVVREDGDEDFQDDNLDVFRFGDIFFRVSVNYYLFVGGIRY
jgi:hypothetical protein